jgi:serine/threonine-protein kinase RsbW
MGTTSTAKFVIPSRLEEVPAVQEAVLREAEAHGFGRDALFAIHLAVEEAVANAIRHGNCCDCHKQVTIEYWIDDEEARIEVCDEGCGFAPQQLPDPTLDENLARPHGRGVMLIKAYMTGVSFNERGNCVTMVKRRNCCKPLER